MLARSVIVNTLWRLSLNCECMEQMHVRFINSAESVIVVQRSGLILSHSGKSVAGLQLL